MLLGAKTSTISLRRSMPKSNNKGQVIINHPQPQKVGLSGLEKVKYIPTSRINTLHFDKGYDIKDIVTAIDATINEVCSPTPMKYTVTGSEGTSAPSVVSTPVRLIQRPFTPKSSLFFPSLVPVTESTPLLWQARPQRLLQVPALDLMALFI